ncbi:TIGR03826 family flagellar region protein [Paenibacillus caui]|uniref:TIGR03826 family flagellar region protein n=1 Tax=Paenibacillus caui TaxID=2873927 RepID=UPI001CA962EF|nr:TIGR03826 family flagellar region protein [Paenibacillus caui]
MNLDNCPRCGKLYAKNFKNLCGNCIADIEKEYDKCRTYLREHKGTHIQELSDATEVSIRQITKFIKEGRISIEDHPEMMYPCEVCGIMIREGNMCESCRARLTRDLTAASRKIAGEENAEGTTTYGAINKLRKD